LPCVAIASLGLSWSFLLQREILINETGTKGKITGYRPGYWLWVAIILGTLIGCIVEYCVIDPVLEGPKGDQSNSSLSL
jgi:hypothetical protein